jgi:hypothetical protein
LWFFGARNGVLPLKQSYGIKMVENRNFDYIGSGGDVGEEVDV